MATPKTPTPSPKAEAKIAVVTLNTPIPRAGGDVTQLTLRKPKGGDLRGFNLQDLMQCDINALIGVVPRISQPFITEQEVAELEADDFAEVGGAVNSFFYTPAQMAMLRQRAGG